MGRNVFNCFYPCAPSGRGAYQHAIFRASRGRSLQVMVVGPGEQLVDFQPQALEAHRAAVFSGGVSAVPSAAKLGTFVVPPQPPPALHLFSFVLSFFRSIRPGNLFIQYSHSLLLNCSPSPLNMLPRNASNDDFEDSDFERRLVAGIVEQYENKVRRSQERTKAAVLAALHEANRAVREHQASMSKMREQWKVTFPKWVDLLDNSSLGSIMDKDPLPGNIFWDAPVGPESVDAGIAAVADQPRDPGAVPDSHALPEESRPAPPVSPPSTTMSETLTPIEPATRQANQVGTCCLSKH